MTDTLPTTPADARLLALTHWVTLNTPPDEHPIRLESLGGDAGFRRYFRFQQPSRWLAVDAPPATEDTRQFLAIAQLLAAQGVHTPEVRAADPDQGFLLVEDMGDQLLFSILTSANADAHYRLAMDTLLQLQRSQDNPSLIPRYDRQLLRRELDICSEWFIGKLLGYTLDDRERELLNTLFTLLEDNSLAQPQCLVHRDYHSRNLLLRNSGDLGVIDFQGALWGGATYDLVSLLRDCYLRWPADKVTEWALYYRQRALETRQLSEVSKSEFLRWFDWLGLQRHIKVLGIFARLHLRDSKPGYLRDLPLVIRYILEIATRYPELQAFAQWFSASLLPLAEQQSWYSDYRRAGDKP